MMPKTRPGGTYFSWMHFWGTDISLFNDLKTQVSCAKKGISWRFPFYFGFSYL